MDDTNSQANVAARMAADEAFECVAKLAIDRTNRLAYWEQIVTRLKEVLPEGLLSDQPQRRRRRSGVALRPIKTDADYQAALARMSELMDMDDEMEILAVLLGHYEAEHYPSSPPDAIAALKFRMEQAGLKQVDLIPYIGSRGRVSEVLSGKRPLSLAMRRKLLALGIPAAALLS